jgi:L-fuculose-phosphate aldolase
LGVKIADEFKKGIDAIIMENHGTVLGSIDLDDAFMRFETLEFCARIIIYGKSLGEIHYLTDEQIAEFGSRAPSLINEMNTVFQPSDEREKRLEICNIIHLSCENGLMIGSFGTVSTRWNGNDFLITPHNFSRWDLQINDIVQIKNGRREPGKLPSRTTWLHHEIYKNNPGINSIISTQSPYLMAFSVAQNGFDVRTIPENWIFLRDVQTLPYGDHSYRETKIPKLLSLNNPAMIICNDSVIITGNTLMQTFNQLEVAEFSAKSIVMSASLGKMTPISDAQIAELKKEILGT